MPLSPAPRHVGCRSQEKQTFLILKGVAKAPPPAPPPPRGLWQLRPPCSEVPEACFVHGASEHGSGVMPGDPTRYRFFLHQVCREASLNPPVTKGTARSSVPLPPLPFRAFLLQHLPLWRLQLPHSSQADSSILQGSAQAPPSPGSPTWPSRHGLHPHTYPLIVAAWFTGGAP